MSVFVAFAEHRDSWENHVEGFPMKIFIGIFHSNSTGGGFHVPEKFALAQKNGVSAKIEAAYNAAQKPLIDAAVETLSTTPRVEIHDVEKPWAKPEPLGEGEVDIFTRFSCLLSLIENPTAKARKIKEDIDRMLAEDAHHKSGSPDFHRFTLITGDVPRALEALQAYPEIGKLIDTRTLQVALDITEREYLRGSLGTVRQLPGMGAKA